MQPVSPLNLSAITEAFANHGLGKIFADIQTSQQHLRAATTGLASIGSAHQVAAQLGALAARPIVPSIASLKFDTGIARMLSAGAGFSTPMSVLTNFRMDRPEVNSKLMSELMSRFEPRKS